MNASISFLDKSHSGESNQVASEWHCCTILPFLTISKVLMNFICCTLTGDWFPVSNLRGEYFWFKWSESSWQLSNRFWLIRPCERSTLSFHVWFGKAIGSGAAMLFSWIFEELEEVEGITHHDFLARHGRSAVINVIMTCHVFANH